MRVLARVLLCLLIVALVAAAAFAKIPLLITIQGQLTDVSGTPLADGSYLVHLLLYGDSTTTDLLWKESKNIEVADGLFSTNLGSAEYLNQDLLLNNHNLFVGIKLDGEPEMLPRTRLTSSAFSFQSLYADSAAAISDGAVDFADLGRNGATVGQVMKWNGSQWIAASDNDGGTAGGWADDGTRVRLLSAADSVGIGTASPAAKLDVDGDFVVSGKATIGAGHTNTGVGAFVAGTDNAADGNGATISGGDGNVALGTNSSIGGGASNSAGGTFAAIAGGYNNVASGTASAVAGGRYNYARGVYSVVSGGGGPSFADSNLASGSWSTIGGGMRNLAVGDSSFVGGGAANRVEGKGGVIGGGQRNIATGQLAFIGGGTENVASGDATTVGGGLINYATGKFSAVCGGFSNQANGSYSTVPGGLLNRADGDYSFAAGSRAKALHDGVFIWADRDEADFTSTAVDQFLIRAAGGVGMGTDTASAQLDVVATPGTRAAEFRNDYSSAGGGVGASTVTIENTNSSGIALYAVANTTDATTVMTNTGNGAVLKCLGSSFVERFRVNANGNVGIGTNAPNYKLDVRGTIGNNTTLFHSDVRWKTRISTIPDALNKVTTLRGVNFEWRHDEYAKMNFPTGKHLGVIAQEVEAVLPELVHTADDGYKSVEYANLTALLIEAVKELRAENEQLKKRMAQLEERLNR